MHDIATSSGPYLFVSNIDVPSLNLVSRYIHFSDK
jgi:hypothetical protein